MNVTFHKIQFVRLIWKNLAVDSSTNTIESLDNADKRADDGIQCDDNPPELTFDKVFPWA